MIYCCMFLKIYFAQFANSLNCLTLGYHILYYYVNRQHRKNILKAHSKEQHKLYIYRSTETRPDIH